MTVVGLVVRRRGCVRALWAEAARPFARLDTPLWALKL